VADEVVLVQLLPEGGSELGRASLLADEALLYPRLGCKGRPYSSRYNGALNDLLTA
jgi:hypothetical protein